MELKIALAGNPNSGKTTLFNALTGSNQFVGNWPGVTVEKKEGRLKKHSDVVITDLPGIYSLSPYTLEEVVARNYLIDQRPDAILNIIDGTNLERNLYLTTQLTELGIPVVIAINMMDVVRKNGDKINTKELSDALGCQVVEISALRGDGIMEAAEAAIQAAKSGKTVPMHTFSGPVEHAIAHIEEAAVHTMPEEQQRWYAIKIFERDDKVLAKMQLDKSVADHIEADIQAAEKELDDDAESIITNQRYVYIGEVIQRCYKKHAAGKLSTSDKIDRIVTNRWLGLPIFAVVMFLVYWVAMVGVGAPATDWANDGVFGDGWHLLGIGTGSYEEAAEAYGDTNQIIEALVAEYGDDATAQALDAESPDYSEEAAAQAIQALRAAVPADASIDYTLEDEETLEVTTESADYAAIQAALDAYGTEPDPADFGVWVPGIPVLIGSLLEKANVADWLSGLILDGIVAGVGAVLGFVPQMLVLFLMLAFLEACGYMARIAFVLDRVFRKFGLSGKSFIPMLIGTGCGVPGIMASRTIENERDRRMTIITTTFIPCGAKVPFISMIAGALFGGSAWVATSAYFIGRHLPEEDQALRRRACPLRNGAARLSPSHCGQCAVQHVGAGMELYQEGRYHHPAVHHLCVVHHLFRLGRRHLPYAYRGRGRILHPGPDRLCVCLDFQAPGLGQLAGRRGFHHRPGGKGKHRRHPGHPVWRRRQHGVSEYRRCLYRYHRILLPGV